MPGYYYFFIAIALLFLGHFLYGRFAEWVFAPDYKQPVPAKEKYDGVDYVELPSWKIFLIQLLNIAGLGPVFGAISGALFGPAALIWIVFGCILGGAVHDFMSGMLSIKHGGDNLPEIIARYLGKGAQQIMRILCICLCVLVGVVFVKGPAGILENMTNISMLVWASIIFIYYFLATVLPIQTIIGKIYPIFGAILIFMAIGIISMLFLSDHTILPNTEFFTNVNPENVPIWPMLFVTIACGAISGFHATQSPLMARCIKSQRLGRNLFYGPMIAEGIIALIWVTVGLSFYPTATELQAAMTGGNPAVVVHQTCVSLMGETGAIIALLGVVILPVTSGDTALRCGRLMIADILKWEQKSSLSRYKIAVPLFICCLIITQVDFQIIWRYFGWFNQVIATLTLWTISVYLIRKNRFHWMTSLPAMMMTAMCSTYLLTDKICLNLPITLSTYAGVALSIMAMLLFLIKNKKSQFHS